MTRSGKPDPGCERCEGRGVYRRPWRVDPAGLWVTETTIEARCPCTDIAEQSPLELRLEAAIERMAETEPLTPGFFKEVDMPTLTIIKDGHTKGTPELHTVTESEESDGDKPRD